MDGEPNTDDRVVVTGVDIPFWDLVKLQVKFVAASVPAAFIVFAIVGVCLVALRELGRH